jgi:Tol biopolymer transport system component
MAGTDRQLTTKSGTAAGEYPGDAMFSPDHQRIAYNWSTAQSLELRVITLSGGEPHRIETGDGVAWLKGWSIDGKELLVVRGKALEETGQLGFLDIDTGRFLRTGSANPLAHARLSPDGTRIATDELSGKDPTERDIRLIDAANGESRLLLAGSDDDYSPEWVPDGKGIVFCQQPWWTAKAMETQLRGWWRRARTVARFAGWRAGDRWSHAFGPSAG